VVLLDTVGFGTDGMLRDAQTVGVVDSVGVAAVKNKKGEALLLDRTAAVVVDVDQTVASNGDVVVVVVEHTLASHARPSPSTRTIGSYNWRISSIVELKRNI